MGVQLRGVFAQLCTDEVGLRELLTRFEQYSTTLLPDNKTDCEIFVEESLTTAVIGLVTQSTDSYIPCDELHVVPRNVRSVFQKTCFDLVQKYEEERDETTLARKMSTAFNEAPRPRGTGYLLNFFLSRTKVRGIRPRRD